MTYVKLKGFKFYKDRHGKRRGYHRASGIAVDLVKFQSGTVEFFAECARIAGLHTPSTASKSGTLDALILDYRASDEFTLLKRRTRADYDRCFNYLAPIGKTSLSVFKPPLIVKIRDKAAKKLGRKWGTYVKTCLSLVFSWGVERGYLDVNPALRVKGVKKPKDLPDANPPWGDEDRHAVMANMPMGIAVEMSLMMFCGLDPGDVVKLPKNAIKDGKLNTKRQKTKEPVWVDLPRPLLDAIEKRPPLGGNTECITFCWNSKGRSWTKSGLDSAWQRYRGALIKAGAISSDAVLTLKGLRHTVATILAEMGYDDRTIADMLGQKTLAMAQHYSKHANRSRKLNVVVKEFDVELDRRKGKIV